MCFLHWPLFYKNNLTHTSTWTTYFHCPTLKCIYPNSAYKRWWWQDCDNPTSNITHRILPYSFGAKGICRINTFRETPVVLMTNFTLSIFLLCIISISIFLCFSCRCKATTCLLSQKTAVNRFLFFFILHIHVSCLVLYYYYYYYSKR